MAHEWFTREEAQGPRFCVLGPVGAVVGDRAAVPGGPGIGGLLAMLLLEPNQVVPVERIVDVLWDHEPPATARTIVQGYISRLRKWLSTVDPGGTTRIQTSGAGYRLAVEEARIDVALARRLLAESRGKPADVRAELLSRAQSLWRGPELSDIAGRVRAPELAELRLTVIEARLDADLELGRHDEVIGELVALVDTHPFREHLVGQLVLALYRSGRRAAALEFYQRFAHRAAGELGLDPGPGLRELHSRVLRDDTTLLEPRPTRVITPRLGVLVPAELPPTPSGFTGRDADLAWLDRLRAGGDPAATAVGVLAGPAGIGKSALAVVWGAGAAATFPDGTLFAALSGFDPAHPPADPAAVLGRFLISLGVTQDDVPTEQADRVALYRTLLAERRVLVVLDDARDSDQVLPLLPGGSSSVALVTSRRRLDGLVALGARLRVVQPLAPDAAAAVIAHAAGTTAAAPDLDRLARLCGCLPLALRIIGARLASSPQWSVGELVERLTDERTRLGALRVEDTETGVRAALDVTVGALTPDRVEALRLVGTVPGATTGPHLLAALAGVDVETARDRLRALAALFLVTETARDVFDAHALVRAYARDLAADRATRLPEVLRYYLAVADHCRRHLRAAADDLDESADLPLPPIPDRDAALDWFETEWPNLLAAAAEGAAAGLHDQVWRLARLAGEFRRTRPRRDDWAWVLDLGLESARAAGDRRGEVLIRLSRCVLLTRFGGESEILADGERAVAVATELRDPRLMVMGHNALASALYGQKRHHDALAHYHRALDLAVRADYRLGEANIHNNIAQVHRDLGDPAEAVAPQTRAVDMFREVGDLGFVGLALANLAELEHELGHLAPARAHATEAITLAAANGLELTEAFGREVLARVLCEEGDLLGTRVELEKAADLYRVAQSPLVATVQERLDTLPAV
ncbi:AfsR/SARP family transcriptional regulator [Actinokineospora spheciospongiae]|uniref:AfsR/SARP family transcriptional regulator n=1 Tax=Actinokineospora spheciospongiae TaxID=909613 RepID=UPI000D70B3C5|nr:BTAD domain-containing putative transcriptional regulator [Actinokineospora spheciospongiae]PWW65809.1 DNA-binding SARP family transcriptional activator [Actinokineospora spheciospongiae]